MITKSMNDALAAIQDREPLVIFNGDCRDLLSRLPSESTDLTITSPPYFLGKAYDHSSEVADFRKLHEEIAADVARITVAEGNVCWQVGNYVHAGLVTPLEYIVHPIFTVTHALLMRNRIVWSFGHGAHATRRFSGRHEVIMWLAKSAESYFDLNAVRVRQKYRGKKHYKGPKKGQWSANPLGKNPGDVWDIPNVKANHVEKTKHPCQFPVGLARRCIRALSRTDGLVVDPFLGSGTTAIAAALEGRRFIGSELSAEYCAIIKSRIEALQSGTLKVRATDQPVYSPRPNLVVAMDPFEPLGANIG